MKITVTTLSEEGLEANYWRDSMKIESPKHTLYFHDGELEDNSIGRNFQDVHTIADLMKETFAAAKAGEELEVIYLEADDINR